MSQLKVMIGRLSSSARKSLENAARLCIELHHAEVDIPHYMQCLVEQPQQDMAAILDYNKLDKSDLIADLRLHLAGLNQVQDSSPVFSNRLMELFESAWRIASSEEGNFTIRSGHVLLALLQGAELAPLVRSMSPQFARIDIPSLKDNFERVCRDSLEVPAEPEPSEATDAQEGGHGESGDKSKTPALDQYTYNLTKKAKDGKIDPVIGREKETYQLIDILTRRRQNNPILTGEAGVGKTAVVEGLALKIHEGSVPDQLKSVQLHVLDMALLQAGASVKGEFENRLKQVIEEVQSSSHPIILFIDEAHTIIGAGGAAGQNDAANLLKPALARGELRTIAATTWAEYKKFFEKDAALSRRFQVVKVDEPSNEQAVKMLRGMSGNMAKHFGILIRDDAIQSAVELSARYISGRQLPDKAIGVLDTAAARVSLSRSAKPNALDLLQADHRDLLTEIDTLTEENRQNIQLDLSSRIDGLDKQRQEIEAEINRLQARWDAEMAIIKEIEAIYADGSAEGDMDTQLKLEQLHDQLSEVQGNEALVHHVLDANVVREVIADWTGIPLGNMMQDKLQQILNLQNQLGERVIGQDHALDAIAQRIRTATAGLEDPNRPQGVFLFVGPSGVGKTETALALAEAMYGGERNVVTINMSEYQEAHTVSGLKGSPPGYVGYGEGGVLTEAVRRKPYSVVLLDEIEKAHPDVLEMFFQVFDKGWMEDGEGRYIDFKNTLIILTSNVASSAIMQSCINKADDERPSVDELLELTKPALYKQFKPAFLGRLKVVPFYPITDTMLYNIIQLKLSHIQKRVEAQYDVPLEYGDDLRELILARCIEVDTGARNIDHILNGTVLPELASRLLMNSLEEKTLERIILTVDAQDEIGYELVTAPASQLDDVQEATHGE